MPDSPPSWPGRSADLAIPVIRQPPHRICGEGGEKLQDVAEPKMNARLQSRSCGVCENSCHRVGHIPVRDLPGPGRPDHLLGNVARLVAERDRLVRDLARFEFLQPIPGSRSNFVLCRVVDRDAAALKLGLEGHGVLVRYFANAIQEATGSALDDLFDWSLGDASGCCHQHARKPDRR